MGVSTPDARTLLPGPRTGTSRTAAPSQGQSGSQGHRRDIQGLRAIAVSLVLVYHLWPDHLPGGYIGVDIFFVISGYLITTHLLLVRPSRPRDLLTFWSRRIRRLLPAAVLVVATTLVLSRAIGPDSRWRHTAAESVMAAFNIENWFLSYRSVDYLAASAPPSPVQHYWSLAVEEQFYVLWPLLLVGAALLSRRRVKSYSSAVLMVLIPVVTASFLWAVHLSATTPGPAFFVTHARVWELGAGALLAAAVLRTGTRRGHGRMRVQRRSALVWIGIAAMLVPASVYSSSTTWPSYPTLLPVLGTVLVIAAAAPDSRFPNRLLAARPVQYLGDISYSVYLWHWPIIILLPAATARPLSATDKLAIVVASLVLAGLTKRFVEDRFRTSRRPESLWRPYVLGAGATAVVVTIAGLTVLEVTQKEQTARAELATVAASGDPCFGAGARANRGTCQNPTSGALYPATVAAITDRPDAWSDGCLITSPFTSFPRCVYGAPDAQVRIALVGNSHAGQWQPTLQRLAEENGWQVTSFTATGCSAIAVEYMMETQQLRDSCLAWGKKVLAATTSGDFDLVVTSELTAGQAVGTLDTGNYPLGTHSTWVQGYRDYLEAWAQADVRVLVVRDTPMPRTTVPSVPDCLAVHRPDFGACSGPRSVWLRPDPLVEAARSLGDPRVTVADLSDLLCDPATCFAVIGRAVVYFDGSHLSATYARTLAPMLEPHIQASLAADDTAESDVDSR